jgi:hypothetical protein
VGKESNTAKFTASMQKARHVWTRLIVPQISSRECIAPATKLPVLTLGKWKIGLNVLILVEPVFSIEESLVIG